MFDDQWVGGARYSELSARERSRGARRHRRQERRRRLVGVARRMLVWAAVLGGIAGTVAWAARDDPPGKPGDLAAPSLLGAADRPSPASGEGHRLLPEVTAPHPDAPFELLARWPGGERPVTYDPCRPIDVVVNPAHAPADYGDIVDAALATATAASGLHFNVETYAAVEEASIARPAYRPSLYGDRWSPVLITWTTPEVIPDLVGEVAGIGGSTSIAVQPLGNWYVTGAIHLDASQLGEDRDATQAVLLHEIGHLLGLDHTTDAEQLMHASSGRTTLNFGDIAGLAAVGAGGCSPRL